MTQQTESQRKYLHVLFHAIARHYDLSTIGDMKEYLKGQFKVESTSKLSKMEMVELIDKITVWCKQRNIDLKERDCNDNAGK